MSQDRFSARFVRQYRTAFGALVVLMALCCGVLVHLMSPSSDDARLINESGRQRMLSQRIALHVATLSRS